MDQLAINWQNFAHVELQLKFTFRIQLLISLLSFTFSASDIVKLFSCFYLFLYLIFL